MNSSLPNNISMINKISELRELKNSSTILNKYKNIIYIYIQIYNDTIHLNEL
jgi:hypothetical protein